MLRLSCSLDRLLISAIGSCVAFCFGLGVFLAPQTALLAQEATRTTSVPTEAPKLALIPMPREIREAGDISLAQGIGIQAEGKDSEDRFAAEDLVNALKERGINARAGRMGKIRIVLLRLNTKKAADILSRGHVNFDPAMRDEGYVLITDKDITYDIATTGAGIYYGAQTIKQLIIGNGTHAVLH